MGFDVFISYPSPDKTVADAVCARLEQRGVRCWIAPRDVPPGFSYGESIIEAIEQCRVMVLVFSANTNASTHVAKEVERAVSHGLTIIPFRIQDVKPTKSLDYFISSVHWLDAITPPMETHLDYLAETVIRILPQSNAPAKPVVSAPPSAPRVASPAVAVAPVLPPTKPSGSSLKWIALLALAALLGGGAWWMLGNKTSDDPIVGCWKWSNNVTVDIRKDGSMTAVTFPGRWRLVDSVKSVYNFTWPEPVDTAVLSNGGRTLSGANQYGFTMSATRISGGSGIVGNWHWFNGAIVNIRPDGSLNAGPLIGRWSGGGQNYQLIWPKPVDTVTLAADHQSLQGGNQYGVPVAGSRLANCGR